MTQTSSEPQQSSVSERLRDARERAGLTLEQSAGATGLLRSYLAALEAGRRRPLPREVDRLARVYDADLSDLLPPRRPVEVDRTAGRMRLHGRDRRLREAADEREVYAAYLFLLYAVRGAAPGQHVPLRSSDVELLMQVVGEDAETIERRLVQLMGCTPEEATKLRQVLLRHRAVTAAVGAAALSWVVLAAPTEPVELSTPAQLSGGTSAASYFDADAPDAVGGKTPPPVQDVLEGAWSPSYPTQVEGNDADP